MQVNGAYKCYNVIKCENTILLSIIIPVYNVEEYLEECLDSVFNQITDECEVICINDGTTDNSYEILKKYKQKFPAVILINQKNQGLSGARNSGLKLATGKYIQFLDSDDYLYFYSISFLLREIKQQDVDIIGFNSMYSNNTLYYTCPKAFSSKILTGKELLSTSHFYPSNVWMYLFKSDFLKSNNLSFAVGITHEDILFTHKALYYSESIIFFPEIIIVYYRIRESSITAKRSFNNIKDILDSCNELSRFYESNHFNRCCINKKLLNLLQYSSERAISHGFKKEFNQYIKKIHFRLEDTREFTKSELVQYKLIIKNVSLFDLYKKNKVFRNSMDIFYNLLQIHS